MFKIICFLSSALLCINSISAGHVDVSELDSVLESMVDGLIHADLTVAFNFQNVGQISWYETIGSLIPDLKTLKTALLNIRNDLAYFAECLQKEDESSNSNDIIVKNSVIERIFRAIEAMDKNYKNIAQTRLASVLANNVDTLHIQNGNIIIPARIATEISQNLQNISAQFAELQTNTNAFSLSQQLLSAQIPIHTSNDGIFEKASKVSQTVADECLIISKAFGKLNQAFNSASQIQSNGEIQLSLKMLPSINNAARMVSVQFALIASDLQNLLNEINPNNAY